MMRKFLIVFMLCTALACKNEHKNDVLLAKVGNATLYKSDIQNLISTNLTQLDSVSLVKSIIENWVRKQVILQQALINLTEEEKNVDKELEEYRTSLIVYKYEQKYIKERLDTNVTEQELLQYYNDNTQNFILNNNVAKAQFIVLAKDINTEQLKTWLRMENTESLQRITEFCYQMALRYDYFNDKWVSFDNLKMLFPYTIAPSDQALTSSKLYEASDTSKQYILYIRELRTKGSQAPFEYVKDDIKNIIVLKRKQQLIKELEQNLYLDALNKNKFTIYE